VGGDGLVAPDHIRVDLSGTDLSGGWRTVASLPRGGAEMAGREHRLIFSSLVECFVENELKRCANDSIEPLFPFLYSLHSKLVNFLDLEL
jgi:hypothetical protein